jgi:phosphopantothenoylcysteine decarboxylase/phosphopantothenate--cysteine ligase
MIIAPASAHTIGKMVHGICDNLVIATYLSARCPVLLAPAMDLDMYQHPSTLHNLDKLKAYGNHIIPAESGELASGLSGEGRMAEPENIVQFIEEFFDQEQPLKGKKVLITSGPTQEPIDAVRYLTNESSGKMGKALAEEAARLGAEVVFISGPVRQYPEHAMIKVVNIRTALELLEQTDQHHPHCDIAIFTAAVADYRVKHPTEGKYKRSGGEMQLDLVENPDIAWEMGKKKQTGQLHLGFALETDQGSKEAKRKLEKKNFDCIVLNSLQDEGAGFEHDTNRITLFDRNNKSETFELKKKTQVAADIFNKIVSLIHA